MNYNPTVLGAHVASKTDPLLIVPSHHYHQEHQQHQNQLQHYDQSYYTQGNEYFPSTATTPRFDNPYSLHEDVANFMNCVKLALQNPYTPLDEHLLRKCIGFTRQFPLVDGITEHVWGGSVVKSTLNAFHSSSSSKNNNNNSPPKHVWESQQKMLLWMQELQHRLEAATKRNLDIAASAFGPCEEARRDRGVSGRSDVEAVRSDLEWWLKQHEELEHRLRIQKEFLKKINADMDYTASGGNVISSSSFQRAKDLQDLQIARALAATKAEDSGSDDGGRNLWKNLQKTMTLVEDVATLSRSVSQQQQELVSAAATNNNKNSIYTDYSSGGGTSRSTSAISNSSNTNNKRSASVKDVAETLNYELLALQATRYRTESVAETREKLVQCVLSLGSTDYGTQKFTRTATNAPRFN